MNTEKFSDSKAVTVIDPGTATVVGVLTGNEIDTQFFNSLTIPVVIDWTAGAISAIGFTESDTSDGTFTAVPDDDVLYYPEDLPIGADQTLVVGCVAKKRFVKMTITADNVGISIVSAEGLLQDSLTKPMYKEASVLADADVIAPGSEADTLTTPAKRLV